MESIPDNDVIKTSSPWQSEYDFIQLSNDDISFIKEHSEERLYPKETVIVEMNERVNRLLYIDKGIVRYILQNSEGEEKTVFYANRFLAPECFFHEQPALYYAKAIDEVVIYAVKNKYIEDILSRPGINKSLLQVLSMKIRVLGWQINDLSLCTAREKVCRLLCCFYINNQINNQKVSLTHQELAFITGLHRVTITNTIAQLKRDGLIKLDENGAIELLDWDELKKEGFSQCF